MWQVVQTKPKTSSPIDWVLEDQTRIIILSIEGYIDLYIDVAHELAQIAKGSAESQGEMLNLSCFFFVHVLTVVRQFLLMKYQISLQKKKVVQ